MKFILGLSLLFMIAAYFSRDKFSTRAFTFLGLCAFFWALFCGLSN